MSITGHGTLSPYAAFNTQTGEILGETTRRRNSAEFVTFLTDIVASRPKRKPDHRRLSAGAQPRAATLNAALRNMFINLIPVPLEAL